MNMTKSRKKLLTDMYMTEDIPNLTDSQREWIRKETAHYIFVNKDENGNHICHCDGCDKDVYLGKTKHKSVVKCPSCGKDMEVHHLWRRSRDVSFDWVVVPMTIDGKTIMLRYFLALRNIDGTSINELARMVIDAEDTENNYTFELDDGVWKYTEKHYFSPNVMGQLNEKRTCRYAKEYSPIWESELKKLDNVKYFDEYKEFIEPNALSYQNVGFIVTQGGLYEKLCKVGLKDLAKEDFNTYRGYVSREHIIFDNNKTSLLGMLGLNKEQFNWLKENPSIKYCSTMQLFPDMNAEEIGLIIETNAGEKDIETIKNYKLSVIHTLRYFKKVGCKAGEWTHYLSMLETLNYKLDSMYLYPRDFWKMDASISDEYEKVLYAEEDSERDKIIRKISKALQETEGIREFFKGANGLQIFVPESSNDFRRESRLLHNCIKTYPDRVAKGETLLFFIRRIDNPFAPYAAMEYRNGRIVQCRFDHNRQATGKVIDFANALAQKLNELNILAA